MDLTGIPGGGRVGHRFIIGRAARKRDVHRVQHGAKRLSHLAQLQQAGK
jgi:hypothetical protein